MIKTVSYETAKALQAAGFPQNSDFTWVRYISRYMPPEPFVAIKNHMTHASMCAAPTAEEILDQIPEVIKMFNSKSVLIIGRIHGEYTVSYRPCLETYINESFAEALAAMWFWLRNHNHLEGK